MTQREQLFCKPSSSSTFSHHSCHALGRSSFHALIVHEQHPAGSGTCVPVSGDTQRVLSIYSRFSSLYLFPTRLSRDRGDGIPPHDQREGMVLPLVLDMKMFSSFVPCTRLINEITSRVSTDAPPSLLPSQVPSVAGRHGRVHRRQLSSGFYSVSLCR